MSDPHEPPGRPFFPPPRLDPHGTPVRSTPAARAPKSGQPTIVTRPDPPESATAHRFVGGDGHGEPTKGPHPTPRRWTVYGVVFAGVAVIGLGIGLTRLGGGNPPAAPSSSSDGTATSPPAHTPLAVPTPSRSAAHKPRTDPFAPPPDPDCRSVLDIPTCRLRGEVTQEVMGRFELQADRATRWLSFADQPSQSTFASVALLPWVQKLEVHTASHLTDLSPLASLPELRELRLDSLPGSTLASLGELPSLQRATLTRLNEPTTLAALSRLKHLEQLTLSLISVHGDPSLAPLGGLAKLEVLSIENFDHDALDLTPIGTLPRLKWLELSQVRDDTDLAPLAEAPALESLSLAHISAKALLPLVNMKAIRRLTLTDINGDISVLAPIRPLDELRLSFHHGPRDLGRIAGIRTRALTLEFKALKSIAPLASMRLESLDMHACNVVDITALRYIKTLKTVRLPRNVPFEQLDDLRRALPDLVFEE